MTQITRKSVPMRGLILLLAMFLSAGLVLSGCGDDDTATTPAPAPPPPPPPAPEPEPEPEPEPPAPEAPATPTGLHVSDTTPTSITWSWDAVEGALGYAVQFSPDEMFDDTDMIGIVLETSFTATPVPPETNVYLRVRAGTGTPEAVAAAAATGDISGLALSDWSTHVTGRTDMVPVPPAPPPAAVMVEFMIPDDAKNKSEFMIPVSNAYATNKEKATAAVNGDIQVTSNTTAVVVPMWIEGAAPVKLHEGDDNTPFKFVNWEAMQSTVIMEGVTFKVMRVTLGANQEMEPTGDVTYVTCGPWSCETGMDAPAFPEESMACMDWTWSLELVPGFVDNTIADSATPANATNDGVDVGWVVETNKTITVTHHFGNTFEVKSPETSKTSRKSALSMLATPSAGTDAGAASALRNINAYSPALTVRYDPAPPTAALTGVTQADHGYPADDTLDANELACASSAYDEAELNLNKPDGCFRVNTAGNANYLADYEVEVGLKAGIPTWGEIAWPEFKDLKCGTHRVEASTDVDVCSLFEEELTRGNAGKKAGWAAGVETYTAETATTVRMITVTSAGSATARQFSTAWFDHDQDGDTDMVDLYNDDTDDLTIDLLDDDGDPMYGDIGKVDNFKGAAGVTTTAEADGKADNYSDSSRACTDEDGGDGCDAKMVIPIEVAFSPGKVFGCDPVEYTLNLECTWDAQGAMGRDAAVNDLSTATDITRFLACAFK